MQIETYVLMIGLQYIFTMSDCGIDNAISVYQAVSRNVFIVDARWHSFPFAVAFAPHVNKVTHA